MYSGLLWTRSRLKHFPYIISFDPHKGPLRYLSQLSLYYRGESGNTSKVKSVTDLRLHCWQVAELGMLEPGCSDSRANILHSVASPSNGLSWHRSWKIAYGKQNPWCHFCPIVSTVQEYHLARGRGHYSYHVQLVQGCQEAEDSHLAMALWACEEQLYNHIQFAVLNYDLQSPPPPTEKGVPLTHQ